MRTIWNGPHLVLIKHISISISISAVWSSWGPSPQLRTFMHALQIRSNIRCQIRSQIRCMSSRVFQKKHLFQENQKYNPPSVSLGVSLSSYKTEWHFQPDPDIQWVSLIAISHHQKGKSLAKNRHNDQLTSTKANCPAPELSNLPTVEPNLPTKARKYHFSSFSRQKLRNQGIWAGKWQHLHEKCSSYTITLQVLLVVEKMLEGTPLRG